MKITVLCENTTKKKDIKAEHGLSLFIETENHNILFDMGQTDLFADNAEKLGIDLRKVDLAVLSHGHYDHSGGIERFISINKTASIYANRQIFGEYYNGTEKYIGVNKRLFANKRFVFTDDVCKIDDELSLYTCNQNIRKYLTEPNGLTKKENGKFICDDFLHEQYLCIEENGKKIIISGCSHKGILNIAKWFKPDVLIGGFHFSKLDCNLDALLLKKYAQELLKFSTKYYTCHCTGKEQYLLLKEIMNKNIEYISAGDSLNI